MENVERELMLERMGAPRASRRGLLRYLKVKNETTEKEGSKAFRLGNSPAIGVEP